MRYKGTFDFPANFEVQIKAPIDGRQLVDYKSDLVDPSTWEDDNGDIWVFDGLVVSVAHDTSVNNGVYFLKDKDNISDSDSWVKIGGDSASQQLELLNIGDPSAIEIFDGYDASGNALIRRIKGNNGIDVSTYDDTIHVGPSGGAVGTGYVFITDVTPTGSGNVGYKTYEDDTTPSDVDLIECTTDTDLVDIHFMAEGGVNYSPEITLDGSTDNNLQQYSDDRRLFNGYFSIDLGLPEDSSAIKTIKSSTGKEDSVKIIKSGAGPEITDITFSSYPGSQTALKEDDEIDVTVTVENQATSCWIEDGKASKSHVSLSLGGDSGAGSGYKYATGTITISSITSDAPVDAQASNDLGTLGDVYTSDDLTIDQDSPVINFNSITYPSGQEALKSSESATVDVSVYDFDSIEYDDVEDQINIPNSNTYSQTKNVTAYVNTYNIDTDNYEIIASKSSNDTSTAFGMVVQLAGEAATIDISTPSRLRSGGNQGTDPQDHTVEIISDQELIEAPSVDASVGTWQGSDFTGGPTTWSRDLQIHDDDPKGTYSFENLLATNLAGVETTTINSGEEYVLGGFVFRTLTVPAYPNRDVSIGTHVVDTDKLECTNLSAGDSGTLNWSYIPVKDSSDNSYTILDGDDGPHDPNGNYWWNADDDNASSNTSGTAEIELEEIE
ncbi:MAG: hypothetical protein ACOCZ5_00900 [bacterium]